MQTVNGKELDKPTKPHNLIRGFVINWYYAAFDLITALTVRLVQSDRKDV